MRVCVLHASCVRGVCTCTPVRVRAGRQAGVRACVCARMHVCLCVCLCISACTDIIKLFIIIYGHNIII